MQKCKICNKEVPKLTAKTQKNFGKVFYSCKKCNWFCFEENLKYNPDRFRRGTCGRCGRYKHELTDCTETKDFYGNIIEDEEVGCDDLWKAPASSSQPPQRMFNESKPIDIPTTSPIKFKNSEPLPRDPDFKIVLGPGSSIRGEFNIGTCIGKTITVSKFNSLYITDEGVLFIDEEGYGSVNIVKVDIVLESVNITVC